MESKRQSGSNAQAAAERIGIELIYFDRLDSFLKGKEKEPFEFFEIDAGNYGRKSVSEVKLKNVPQKTVKSWGKVLKDFFLNKLDGKKKGIIGAAVKEEEQLPEADAVIENTSGAAEMFKGNIFTITLIFFVLVLGAGVVYFWPSLENSLRQGAISDFIETGKEIIGGLGKEKEPVDYEQEQEVSRPELALDKLIESGKVGELEFEKTAIQRELLKEDIYEFIEANLPILEKHKVYFLKVLDENGEMVDFGRAMDIMELGLMPGWEEKWGRNLLDYCLMLYVEPDEVVTENKIRMGLFLAFGAENNVTIEVLKSWEETLVSDFAPMYFGGNEAYLTNSKLFKNSSIDNERRFVNFIEDGTVSLDYGIVDDGVVIATSQGFETLILSLLLENGSQIESQGQVEASDNSSAF
ncbi:hypothetical protein KJ912_03875 [Patescibacteria group bacterium]|nr:hypothetical protein [Patescibacteria group bacterium]